jgi:hypothetical protein
MTVAGKGEWPSCLQPTLTFPPINSPHYQLLNMSSPHHPTHPCHLPSDHGEPIGDQRQARQHTMSWSLTANSNFPTLPCHHSLTFPLSEGCGHYGKLVGHRCYAIFYRMSVSASSPDHLHFLSQAHWAMNIRKITLQTEEIIPDD